MSAELAPVEFLLYDNYSRSPFGRDWGLKAATGELAVRAEIRRSFAEYCTLSFDTRQDALRDFGYALGGVGLGPAYLLCVTIESPDHLGRPSCAIVGLWFPHTDILTEFLQRADIRATAAQAVGNEFPPTGGLAPLLAQGSPISRRQGTGLPQLDSTLVATMIFERGQTPQAIVELLLDRVGKRRKLPKVLGVTSLRDVERFAEKELDLVCGLTSLSSVRRQSVEAFGRPKGVARPSERPFRHRIASMAAAATLTAGIGIGAYLFILPTPAPEPNGQLPSTIESVPAVSSSAPPSEPPPPEHAVSNRDEEFLAAVKIILEEIGNLDPGELKNSRVAMILATVPLVKAEAARHRELAKILNSELPKLKEQLTGSAENLPFFFKGAALGSSVQERADTVRRKLQALGLDGHSCQELRYTFAFEFRDKSSAIYRWCDISDRILSLCSGPLDQVH